MVRRGMLLVSALLWAEGAHAQNVTRLDAVAGVPAIDKTTQAQDVRFRDTNGDRMTVQVKVGGAGPYRFLVDTGVTEAPFPPILYPSLPLRGSGLPSCTPARASARSGRLAYPALNSLSPPRR